MAVLLSFLCPGLGHIYLGKPMQAALFFVLTLVGYCAMIVPGVAVHLFTIIDASREATRQKKRDMRQQADLLAAAMRK